MIRTTLEKLQKAIDDKYRLTRDGRDWELADGVKLRVPNRHSLGFSLDNRKTPPFAFFSGNPPAHVAKMCDAIVVLPYQGSLYFFVVEQKTGNKDDYARQLANGKFFCEWLVACGAITATAMPHRCDMSECWSGSRANPRAKGEPHTGNLNGENLHCLTSTLRNPTTH